jgi:sugar lactone lactonase YvrE
MNFLKRTIAFFLTIMLIQTIFFVGLPAGTLIAEETPTSSPVGIIGGGLPKGIFFNPTYLNVEQQRLYVSDTGNNRIQAFIRGNVFQLAFGGFGQNEREFDRVGGICSNETNVFIVDSGNSRVQIFDSKANYVAQFGTFGAQDGSFKFPTDIAINADRLYVIDSGNQRIQIFDLQGKFLSSFGKSGTAPGDFNSPTGIEVAEGKIIVSDTGNNRIQIFDLLGVFQTSFGYYGTEEKAFNQPKGLCYDDGKLYIAEAGNKRVQVFSLTGNFLSSLSYDGFKSPCGVAILDNKVLVADSGLNKILSLEKDGKLYGYFGSPTESKGRFVKPISVAVSEDKIFVLDAALKTIQIFNSDKTLYKILPSAEIEKANFLSPIAIVYMKKFLYVLDENSSKISIFSEEGIFQKSFGEYGSDKGKFIFPSDLAIFGQNIFVADSGNSRIQIFDTDGTWIRSIGSYGTKDGQFVSIKGITVQENRIFVMDSGNNRIQSFDFDGNFIAKFGKKGFEIGNYYGANGISSDISMKLYIADTFNHRVQIFDTLTNQSHVFGRFGSIFQFDPNHPEESNFAKGEKDYDFSIFPGAFSFPSDLISFQNDLIVVDTYNVRIQTVPFASIFPYDTIRLSPTYLDFGSVSPDSTIERNFLIQNESGSILEGAITSDNPSITVSPATFKGFNQDIKVKVTGSTLQKGKQYNSKLSVAFKNAITKTIDITFKAESTPDFYVVLNPLLIASADDDAFRIPIKIVPQNGFSGLVTFIALGLPKNTSAEFDPPSVNLPETDTVQLKLRASTKFIEAGIYNIDIEAKAAKGDIIHKAGSTFIYKQELALVMHTVLGELFTAIWCLNCVYSHYAMDRLFLEMGKENVAFIEYYVQSTDDQATARLAYIESEQRMKWYMSDQGIPDIFFDGTDHIKGIPNLSDSSDEAKRRTMYDAYKKKIIEKSKDPSLVSITARSKFDSNNKTGSVTASVIALDNIPYKDPRIYFALTEHNIPYVAINGDKKHYFVLRDFITPLNDNKNDYLGTPMKLPTGGVFGKKGDSFQIDVNFKLLDIYNLSNLSMIVFVQDNVTKKVLQTQVYPVKVINLRNFDIISEGSMTQKRIKGEEVTLTSYVRNSGTIGDTYDLTVTNKTKDKWLYQVYVDGKEIGATGNGDIVLGVEAIAKIDIKVFVPGNAEIDANQQFFIQVKSVSSLQTKSFSGNIDIIESRPPDFILKAERIGEETKVLAGDTVSYKVSLIPDPQYEDPITLSLKEVVPEIESYKFEPVTGKAPFESILSIVVKPDTETKDVAFSILATGNKLQKVINLQIPVITNPDAVPPNLDIAFPPENYLTNKVELEVTGMVDPTVEIKINDKFITKESNGSFTYLVKLSEGQNSINFLAKNRRGLTTEITRIVTLDTVPPKLSVDDIDPEVTTNTVTIKGRTEKGAVVTISTDKAPSDVPVDQNGEFLFPVPLEKGYNTIEVVAIDPATNSTSISIDVRLITLIKLRIGSKDMIVNGVKKILDAPPYIKNGRTMVPLRAIAEAFGATIEWNNALKEITITRKGKVIRMRIGSRDAYTKEEGQTGETRIVLEAPPEIVNGRTFVPLRFIAEAFGSEIKNYDAKTKEITIVD